MFPCKFFRLLLVFIILTCEALFSHQAREDTFITYPKDLQHQLPIFPTKVPPGLSTFSTSTAIAISFAKHQCVATATATGVCRNRPAQTIADEPSILANIKNYGVAATAVLG